MSVCEVLAESKAVYVDACALAKISVEEDPASALVRCLIYMSRIPAYCSLVGFGEFVSVAGKKLTQQRIGGSGYLYSCRSLEMGQLNRVEPVNDRFQFIREAEDLLSRHGRLGGGDLWHIMAARQLAKDHTPSTLFSFDKDLVDAAVAEGVQAVYGFRVDRETLIQELTAS